MNEFLNLVSENIEFVVGIPVASLIIGLAVRWGVNKLSSILIPWIEKIVRTMLQQFFGVDTSNESISELPIVGDIQDLLKKNLELAEMELLKLKKESVSPLYSPEEILVLRAMYNKMFDAYKDKISEETKTALSIYDNE